MHSSFSQNSLIKLFQKSQTLFLNGRLTQSRQQLQLILNSSNLQLFPNLHYEALLNLSTIFFQLNDTIKAREILKAAIKLNQQRYEAFYNLAIVNYHSKMLLSQTKFTLQYSLSLLYLQLAIINNSIKLINKSISLNSSNPKAYIHKALIYEKNQQIQLAQQQFEKITIKSDMLQLSPVMMIEIYQQKTLFYRRIKQTKKLQQNLIIYNKLKKSFIIDNKNQKQGHDNQKEIQNQYIKKIFQSQNDNSSNQIQQSEVIVNLTMQIQNLIKQVQKQKDKRRRIQHSYNNKCKNFSKQNEQETPKQKFQQRQLPQKVSSMIQQQQSDPFLLSPNSIDHNYSTQANQNSSLNLNLKQSGNHQYPSISINQDQDSAILNQKIQQLQRQIKQSGGNVPEFKDTSKISQEENFLEYEIEKTIQEINNKKQLNQSQIIGEPKTLKSTIGQTMRLTVSGSGSSWRKSSIQDDTITLRSKISDSYEINLEEMRTYDTFQLEIRSVSIFDENCTKKEAYIKVKYMEKVVLTEKCKNEKLTWNHNFEEEVIFHPSEEQSDQGTYQLSVELYAKEGGWLSWNRDILLGAGTIKLTEKGTTKCTLQYNQKKVGMLYYKYKLKKHPNQKDS